MFRGFQSYIPADAHGIYDATFRGEVRVGPDDKPPIEVGCWAALRRYRRLVHHVLREAGQPDSLF